MGIFLLEPGAPEIAHPTSQLYSYSHAYSHSPLAVLTDSSYCVRSAFLHFYQILQIISLELQVQ